MIIDTHAHTVPGTMLDALKSEPRLFPSVRLHADGPMPRLEFAAGGPGRPIQPRLWDLAQRRDWLQRRGSTASWSAAGPMSTATICRARRAPIGRASTTSTCKRMRRR